MPDGQFVRTCGVVVLTFCLLDFVVSVMLYDCSLCIAMSMSLFVFVNCLLNEFVICFDVVAILVLFGSLFWFGRPCIVFQSMCVLCL